MIYRLFYRHVLERFDAERTHVAAASALGLLAGPAWCRRLLRRLLAPHDPALEVTALGLRFPSPLGVAAGLDKEASWFEGLGAIGFGFVEIGTVTGVPQPGNDRPRVFRAPADRALVNSMGFPNPGAEAVAARLRGRHGGTLVGANVGKSKVVPNEDAAADYRVTVRRLAPLADYLVLNVSSPNTPGLRDLQAIEPLRALVLEVLAELAAIDRPIPVLVKIAPDLDDDAIDEICDLALELGLAGLIATNTTIDHGVLAAAPEGARGGVSGAPLKPRSLAVLRRLRARAGDRLVLVSVGGVESVEDAWERILAGATLVQAYTGFVYGGPLWPRRINRGLSKRVRARGGASIQDFVGTGGAAPPASPGSPGSPSDGVELP